MANKKIKLVFHVGRGKTATTFIQRHAEKVSGIKYIGKLSLKERNERFLKPVSTIHYKLFERYRGEVDFGFPSLSRNSFELVNQYVDGLVEIIKENPDETIFILSDECISDYYNYLGELYTFLTLAIGNLLEAKLGNDIEIEKVLSVTIRNQADCLASIYAFSPAIGGSFKNFVGAEFKNLKTGFSSGLYYHDCLSLYQAAAGDKWTVKFTPYELLSVDKDPIAYFREVFDLPETLDFSSLAENKRINTSSKKVGSEYLFIKNKLTWFGRLGFRLVKGTGQSARLALDRKHYESFLILGSLNALGKIFQKIDSVLNIILPFQRKKAFEVNRSIREKVVKNYYDDNIKLDLVMKQFDLKRYGYFG